MRDASYFVSVGIGQGEKLTKSILNALEVAKAIESKHIGYDVRISTGGTKSKDSEIQIVYTDYELERINDEVEES